MKESMPELHLLVDPPSRVSLVRGGQTVEIHPLWLRERCTDGASVDSLTGQRLYDPSDVDLQLSIKNARCTGDELCVRFSDGYETRFSVQRLLAEAAQSPGSNGCPSVRLWDAKLDHQPSFAWEAHPARHVLRSWLEAFLRHGFIRLTGTPRRPNSVLDIAAQFGVVRTTNFGALFDVRSTPAATDLAYTSAALDPHTDNPYRTPVPGVQLLHCLINDSSGGESTLVDGFAVAEALRVARPQAFEILTRTPVQFRYRDLETELTESLPCIELDVMGRLKSIHFSPRLDYVALEDRARLDRYYAARREFDHRLRSAEYEIRFLLNPGDVIVFDNCRLLHGRTRFDPAAGLRHLQGCYIDIDAMRSRYRVLSRDNTEFATLAKEAV